MVALDERLRLKDETRSFPEISHFANKMQSSHQDRGNLSLSETLSQLLETKEPEGLAISTLTHAIGEKGFGLILMILALPSALPVPAPGYSTPFGIVITLLGIQMIRGREAVWLPKVIGQRRIKPALASKMLRAAATFLQKIERLVRPRHRWIQTYLGQAGLASIIIIMACLMSLPIPLTNTFPAMVIFLIGIGLSEEDGLLALGAFFVGCAAVLLYAGIVYLLVTQGPDAIEGIKDGIKAVLSTEIAET